MAMLETINNFVDTMVECQGKFENVQKSIREREENIHSSIEQLDQNLTELLSQPVQVEGIESEDLNKIYADAQRSLESLAKKLMDEIQSAQKGFQFIREHETSFNIAVFGKVKAGKSYLGNFVMGNPIRKRNIPSAYDRLEPPVVTVYDRGKTSTQDRLEEIEEGDFAVGASETTSTIQYFKLGGLTWFDTPGIGSVTWENEMLAKDYVTNADLVIFTCNSDAAGTRQDFTEMKELYKVGKAFLLLLTQSDTMEDELDDDGEIIGAVLYPKSQEDRAATEQYMRETLRKENVDLYKKGGILTVSAKLALNALEKKDENLFRDSHMGDLLQRLVDITTNDGATLKLRTPTIRLNEAIDQLNAKLSQADREIQHSQNQLKEKIAEIQDSLILIQESMKIYCRHQIDTILLREKEEIEQNGGSLSEQNLSRIISERLFDIISREVIQKFSNNIGSILSLSKDMLVIKQTGSLRMKQEKQEYERPVTKSVERSPDDLLELVGSLLFDKTYYRTVIETKKETRTFDIGVNHDEVNTIIQTALDDIFQYSLPELLKEVVEYYLSPISNLHQKAFQYIQETQQRLEKIKC